MFMVIGSVLLTLFLFFIVVLVHECGHFFAARSIGVRVKEFGIGIPPRIKSIFRDRHGTEYTLNSLPIGGFVRLEGEELSENGPKSLRSKSLLGKLWVLLAGIGMNFLFAWMIFSVLFMTGVGPLTIHTSQLPFERTSYLIPSFDSAREMGVITASGIELVPMPSSPASQAGISSGSLLRSINGMTVFHPDRAIELIQASSGSVLIKYQTVSGSIMQVDVFKNSENRIGAYVAWHEIQVHPEIEYKVNILNALQMGAKETYSQILIAGESIATIISRIVSPDTQEERREAVMSLGGPISAGEGVYRLLDQSVPVKVYIIFAALLSISIGFFNLLPIPALDGGRVVEETIASILKVCGVKPKGYDHYIRYYHAGGFVILIVLSILIAIKDVVW